MLNVSDLDMMLKAYGKTDVGRKRQQNEDNILVAQKHNIFAVCDGMGGHASGEVASSYAVELIEDFVIKKNIDVSKDIYGNLAELPENVQKFITAIRFANQRIYLESVSNPKRKGMGTTIAAVYFDKNEGVSLINVGDSRIYRFRQDGLEQLTKDHTWMDELLEDKEISEKEASQFSRKNVITRALGVAPVVKIDIRMDPVQDGDLFLICSDGLTGMLSNEDITAIIKQYQGDIQRAVDCLIAAANDKGGTDNISAIIIQVCGVTNRPDGISESHTVVENEATTKSLQKLLKKHYTVKIKKRSLPVPLIILFAFIIVVGVIVLMSKKSAPPKPCLSKLNIRTRPEDVRLKLDGEVLGVTPLTLDSLSLESTYVFILMKDGYITKTESVIVKDTVESWYIRLRPEAVVKVTYLEAKTGDAELFIDGKKCGMLRELEDDDIPISKGLHHLEVFFQGNSLISEKLEIKEGTEVLIIPDESKWNRIKVKES